MKAVNFSHSETQPDTSSGLFLVFLPGFFLFSSFSRCTDRGVCCQPVVEWQEVEIGHPLIMWFLHHQNNKLKLPCTELPSSALCQCALDSLSCRLGLKNIVRFDQSNFVLNVVTFIGSSRSVTVYKYICLSLPYFKLISLWLQPCRTVADLCELIKMEKQLRSYFIH